MADSPPRDAFAEDTDLASRTGPMRRDSDWGGHPRTHEEDLAWAAKRAAVSMAAATIHASSGGTGAHSDDVVHLCGAIADELGVHGHERTELLAAAQLHDIGKVAIPQDLLEKPAPLDEQEWRLIRHHTVAGQRIVESVPELRDVARLVRHSHERWDGGGYPDRLSGESIPLGSRIVFCADAFHAIRSDRPYRRGRTAQASLEEVKRNAGSQFDPEVAAALVKSAGEIRNPVRARARGLTTTLRSRRLVSLLATLAIGGSALAAGGSYVLRDESDPAGVKGAPAARSEPDAGGVGGAPKRETPATAPRVKRSGTRTPAAHGSARGPAPKAGSSPTPGRRTAGTPAAGTPGPPSAVPRRRRVGRPVSPGRSGEAPRRPAQPGKPVGGAPGRSEEAPGRPVDAPAKPSNPKAGPRRAPAAQPPGTAKSR